METGVPPAELSVDDPGGSAAVVVLLHGAMDRSSSLARTARHLSDLRVLRYDRRGYARSLGAGPASLDGHVQDLFAVLGDRPATVVGHSFGGVVALAAAARGPDQIRSVGAYEPPTPWTGWWRAASGDRSGSLLGDPADVAEAFLSRMIGAERWNRLPRSYRDQRRAEGEALTAELRSIENPTAPFDATELRVPVMIGRGREAGRRHGRACEDLVAAIPGAVLHVIEVAGHDAHASHPEAYADYVRLTVARGEGR